MRGAPHQPPSRTGRQRAEAAQSASGFDSDWAAPPGSSHVLLAPVPLGRGWRASLRSSPQLRQLPCAMSEPRHSKVRSRAFRKKFPGPKQNPISPIDILRATRLDSSGRSWHASVAPTISCPHLWESEPHHTRTSTVAPTTLGPLVLSG